MIEFFAGILVALIMAIFAAIVVGAVVGVPLGLIYILYCFVVTRK